jgi:hypothetical protein
VRGAKVYDPRTGLTVWSQNPALLMRYVHDIALLGRSRRPQDDDTAIGAAATICDELVTARVNGQTYTRALYTAGLVVKSGTRPKDALDDLALAMAGRWIFTDGQLRVKAGAYVTPLQTIDGDWLSDAGAGAGAERANRADVFNVVTGRFVDEQRDYVELDYPRVESATYQDDDGAELPLTCS